MFRLRNRNGIIEVDRTEFSFCKNKISNQKSKCIAFYENNKKEKPGAILKCPFGLFCVKTKDEWDYFCGLGVNNAELKAVRQRFEKDGKPYRVMFLTENSYHKLKEKGECYRKCLSLMDAAKQIRHDVSNALQYMIVLSSKIMEKEHNNTGIASILDNYSEIQKCIAHISDENMTVPSYDYQYDWETLFNKMNSAINNFGEKLRISMSRATPYINKFDIDTENEEYCCIQGFSLLDLLFKRDIQLFSEDHCKQQKYRFKLHNQVTKLVNMLRYHATMHDVSFREFEGKQLISINNFRDDIYVALFTLIDNAIKYSVKGKQIEISMQDLSESTIEFTIENHSKYISNNDLKHIFEKGYRGENKSSDGNGLGLYLVKRIIDSCHGNISAYFNAGIFKIQITLSNHD